MLALFVTPDLTGSIASSSEQAASVAGSMTPLLAYLAIPIVLVGFGLTVWGVKRLLHGGKKALTGGKKRRRRF